MYESIVKKTPVDTGRARGNWQIGIGQDIISTTPRTNKTGNVSGETNKLSQVSGDETIYISNNLPYIVRLEYGSSKQAPNGMVGLTTATFKKKIDEAVKESGWRDKTK